LGERLWNMILAKSTLFYLAIAYLAVAIVVEHIPLALALHSSSVVWYARPAASSIVDQLLNVQ